MSRRHLYCGVAILMIISCRSKPSVPNAKPAIGDTAKYYPLADFFREQVMYVDLRNFLIKQVSTHDGKKDSSVINKDQFIAWGDRFTAQAVFFQKNKQFYKESVFQDLSTKSYTLNYSPLDHQQPLAIQNIDVLLNDETNQPKWVFIKRIYTSGDTTVTEQYSWKALNGLQFTRFTTAGNHYTSSDLTDINWNDKP